MLYGPTPPEFVTTALVSSPVAGSKITTVSFTDITLVIFAAAVGLRSIELPGPGLYVHPE